MVPCIQSIDKLCCTINIFTSHFYIRLAAYPTQNIFPYTFWQVPQSVPACRNLPQMCTSRSPPHSLSYRSEYGSMVIPGNIQQTLSDLNSTATPFILMLSLHMPSLTLRRFWPPTAYTTPGFLSAKSLQQGISIGL